MKIYGIPNCDTVKKARSWLEENKISVLFHDFKKEGVPVDHLEKWLNQLGWETVVNRRGTTWRKLDESIRLSITDNASALPVLKDNPSLIKRPILENGDQITAGFDTVSYERLLK